MLVGSRTTVLPVMARGLNKLSPQDSCGCQNNQKPRHLGGHRETLVVTLNIGGSKRMFQGALEMDCHVLLIQEHRWGETDVETPNGSWPKPKDGSLSGKPHKWLSAAGSEEWPSWPVIPSS